MKIKIFIIILIILFNTFVFTEVQYFRAVVITNKPISTNYLVIKNVVKLYSAYKVIEVENTIYRDGLYNTTVSKGDAILIKKDGKSFSIVSYFRANILLLLFIIYIFIIIFFFRKGCFRIISSQTLITIIVISSLPFFILTSRYLLITGIIIFLVSIISILSSENDKPSFFIMISAIFLTSILSFLLSKFILNILDITGFFMDNAYEIKFLSLHSNIYKISPKNIVVISGILIISGIIIDFTVTIINGLEELYLKNHFLSLKKIYLEICSISSSIALTMISTLIIIIIAEKIPSFLIYRINNVPILKILNTEEFVVLFWQIIIVFLSIYIDIILCGLLFYFIKIRKINLKRAFLFIIILALSFHLYSDTFLYRPDEDFKYHPLLEEREGIKYSLGFIKNKGFFDNRASLQYYDVKMLSGKFAGNIMPAAYSGIDIMKKNITGFVLLKEFYENNNLTIISIDQKFRLFNVIIIFAIILSLGFFIFKKNNLKITITLLLTIILMIFFSELLVKTSPFLELFYLFLLFISVLSLIAIFATRKFFYRIFISATITGILIFIVSYFLFYLSKIDLLSENQYQLLIFFKSLQKNYNPIRLSIFILTIGLSGAVVDILVSVSIINRNNPYIVRNSRTIRTISSNMMNTVLLAFLGQNFSELMLRFYLIIEKRYIPNKDWYYFKSLLQTLNMEFVFIEFSKIILGNSALLLSLLILIIFWNKKNSSIINLKFYS